MTGRIKDPAARMLSVTITGPEGMLAAMANLLRAEGYTVGRTLAEAFDAVLAAYLKVHNARPSMVSAAELGLWCAAVSAARVDVDGVVEEQDGVRIEYWGKATRQPDGSYHAIANVNGALCRVQCTIVHEVK